MVRQLRSFSTIRIVTIIILFTIALISFLGNQYIKKISIPTYLDMVRTQEQDLKSNIENFFNEMIQKWKQVLINNETPAKKIAQLIDTKNMQNITSKIFDTTSIDLHYRKIFFLSHKQELIDIDQGNIIEFQPQLKFFEDLSTQSLRVLSPIISKIFIAQNTQLIALCFSCITEKKNIGSWIIILEIDWINEQLQKLLVNNAASPATMLVAQKDFKKVYTIYSNDRNKKIIDGLFLGESSLAQAFNEDYGTDISMIKHVHFATARGYIISTNWTTIVEISVQSYFVMEKILHILLIICTILASLLFVWHIFDHHTFIIQLFIQYTSLFITIISFLILFLSFSGLIYFLTAYKNKRMFIYHKKQQEASTRIEYATAQLLKDLSEIKYTTRTLMFEYTQTNFSQEKIEPLITDILKKKSCMGIFLIETKSSEPTYTLFTNKDNKIIKKIIKQIPIWSTDILHKKSAWIGPFKDKELNKNYMIYAEISGDNVIAYVYPYELIKHDILLAESDRNKNSFLINKEGSIVYEDNINNILQNISIFEKMNDQFNNQILQTLYMKGKQGYSGHAISKNNSENEHISIFYESIPITDWIAFFMNNNRSFFMLTTELLHLSLWILLSSIISFIALFVLLLQLFKPSLKLIKLFFFFCSLMSSIGTLFMLLLTYYYFGEHASETVTYQQDIRKFVDQESKKWEQPPVLIHLGTTLDYLKIVEINKVNFIMRVWVTIEGKENFSIIEGINVEGNITPLVFTKDSSAIKDNLITKEWEISGTIVQNKFNVSLYPLDVPLIIFSFSAKNPLKPVILLPEIITYDTDDSTSLNDAFNIEGFLIKKTYFTIQNMSKTPVKNFSNQLSFNIILQRNVSDAFLRYILPFLIIIISLFCILVLASERNFKLVQYYTGLFFSLILVHYNLRSLVQATTVIYLEYFILIGYVIIALAVFDLLLDIQNYYYLKLRNISFWLIFTTLIFTTTFFQIITA